MESVFTKPPPNFFVNEVKGIIKDKFHLIGNVKELYSDRDQNFLIESNSGKYILKIFNSAEIESIIDLQFAAIDHISKMNNTIKVPNLKSMVKVTRADGNKFIICLIDFIEGSFLFENKSNIDYYAFGNFMGKVSWALQNFEHESAQRKFEWDPRNTEILYRLLKNIKSKDNRETILYFLDKWFDSFAPNKDLLRMAIIHNDGNDHNILVDNLGNTIGIIDFGDLTYSYQIFEPAVCMAYCSLDVENYLEVFSKFLRGYQFSFPLRDAELKCIIYAVCLRLCLSVSICAWRKNIFPENNYITISESSAWLTLNTLKTFDLEELTNKLISNVQSK